MHAAVDRRTSTGDDPLPFAQQDAIFVSEDELRSAVITIDRVVMVVKLKRRMTSRLKEARASLTAGSTPVSGVRPSPEQEQTRKSAFTTESRRQQSRQEEIQQDRQERHELHAYHRHDYYNLDNSTTTTNDACNLTSGDRNRGGGRATQASLHLTRSSSSGRSQSSTPAVDPIASPGAGPDDARSESASMVRSASATWPQSLVGSTTLATADEVGATGGSSGGAMSVEDEAAAMLLEMNATTSTSSARDLVLTVTLQQLIDPKAVTWIKTQAALLRLREVDERREDLSLLDLVKCVVVYLLLRRCRCRIAVVLVVAMSPQLPNCVASAVPVAGLVAPKMLHLLVRRSKVRMVVWRLLSWVIDPPTCPVTVGPGGNASSTDWSTKCSPTVLRCCGIS